MNTFYVSLDESLKIYDTELEGRKRLKNLDFYGNQQLAGKNIVGGFREVSPCLNTTLLGKTSSEDGRLKRFSNNLRR